MSWQFLRQSRRARLIGGANIGLLFSFISLRGRSILRVAILDLCVPINLLQVGSTCSLLHPRQRAQSTSVPMATLPRERRGKGKRCHSIYEPALLRGTALPAAWLNGLVVFSFLSLISLSIDSSLPEGITGFKSFIFWFLNCSSSPGSLLLLQVRSESQSH